MTMISEEFKDAMRAMSDHTPRPQLGRPFKMQIKAGCYMQHPLQEGAAPQDLNASSDELFVFRDEGSQEIRKIVKEFKEGRDKYHGLGLLHKMGMMVYGPPGSGKSSIVKNETSKIVAEDGVVFISGYPYGIVESIRTFRKLEGDRDLTVVLEDIDEIVRSYGEHSILEMMDGMDTADHVLFIGTTNHPERLSAKMKRPGRFDRKVYIPQPTVEQRLDYLRLKLGDKITRKQRVDIAAMTEGFSFGHLRQLTVDVFGYGMSVKESVKGLRSEYLTDEKQSDQDCNPSFAVMPRGR